MRRPLGTMLLALACAIALTSCATPTTEPRGGESPSSPSSSTSSSPSASQAQEGGTPRSSEVPTTAEPAQELSSAGRPARAELSIPAIGVEVPVVPYRGWTDDAPGTAIQNRGRAASPHGPRGGTGPGGIGNYQVTAHRLSSTKAFLRLPELRPGDRVHVRTAEATYVYRITDTRRTSFRSASSLRAQRAAVPGRPGEEPTRAMITLSTCATPEDHAEGNYWSDEFDNPEHRIDKIGVLVAIR